MRATPEQVRLILVDPKRVELGQYNGLPHLLTQVVVDPKKAANALSWAVTEMERRYDILAEAGMRDIDGYNEALDADELGSVVVDLDTDAELDDAELDDAELDDARLDDAELDDVGLEDAELDDGAALHDDAGSDIGHGVDPDGIDIVSEAEARAKARVEESRAIVEPQPHRERLPYVLIVVDELNDLMMVAARDVEESVCRIAQMARAVGIHLVLATQRPSVDVITGVIKANVPSRLAFSVSSLADSRVILDQPGAERLVGKGDMLLLTASSSVARRIQGPWVAESEVRSVVAHWRRQHQPQYVEALVAEGSARSGAGGIEDEDDDLLPAAMELVVRSQLGSTSMLQRKLRVGFSRAGRLMDLLERRGVVGPSEGSKARAVLMTPEEFEQLSDR
jgi:S-DNA-T family DNA segregation ATPase FtsK/SpoIIIE